jgi:membrane-bound serine protease (ClpP class)
VLRTLRKLATAFLAPRSLFLVLLLSLSLCPFVPLSLALSQSPHQQPIVDKFTLADTIQPVTAGQLDRALARASADNASALLIEIDTPGGLVDSMRSMAGAILTSRVPVIIYVAPAGARAASAGFFLLESADIAAMAPGTNAGAAHVVFESGQPDPILSQKVENDAEAFMRSYVAKRGRNQDAAIAAVKDSHAYSAEEALAQGLIDLTAPSDAELIAKLDNRTITRMDGSKLTLHLANARIQTLQSTLREDLLDWLINPNIALMLLVGGALLIYLEFNTPGTIVPGALGALMVLLGVFALNLLPIRYTAVMLLVAAVILLVLEAKFGGHGALAIAGTASLVLGMMTLVASPIPQLDVHPWLALSIGIAFGLITVFLLRLAVRARRQKTLIGVEALIGHIASAMEPLAPAGHILVEGEIWRAIANNPGDSIPTGTPLRVTGHSENLLRVTPIGQ